MAIAGGGVSTVGVLLLLFAGGGFLGTTGVTPLPEDPVVARIAPAECLFYCSWTGKKEASADGASSTERLFSDAKFLDYLNRVERRIHEIAASAMGEVDEADVFRLVKHLQTHAGAFYVTEVIPKRRQIPKVRGGLVLRVDDDDMDSIVQATEALLQRVPSKPRSQVKIGDSQFSRIELLNHGPVITWGMNGNYLILAVGEEEAEKIVQRLNGSTPEWLTEAKQAIDLPRPSSFANLDIRLCFAAVRDFSEPQDVVVLVGLLEAFGFDAMESFSYASGLDDRGCVNRGRLKCSGDLSGMMTLLDCEPIRADDLQEISSESPVAIAFQFSLADALTAFLRSCEHEMAPPDAVQTATELRQQLAALDEALGFNVREDLLASLGNTWRVFVQPGPLGLVSRWTISIELADSAKFSKVHKELVTSLQKNLAGTQNALLTLTQVDREKAAVFSAQVQGLPFVPAWCIDKDRLVIGTSPDSVYRLVSEPTPTATLASADHIRPLLDDARNFKLIHIDARAVAEFVTPLLAQQLAVVPQGVPIDASLLPPLDILSKHLRPTAMAVRRTDDGVEFVRHRTLPGLDFGQAATLLAAASLPAVGGARDAAKHNSSVNYQKHISLALLNFESVYGAFPAGYSADAEGKPLLSWRVHILPYVDEQALYDQFHLDEPWDSPHNKKLIEQMPEAYRSPHSKAKAGKTTYLGVGGADGIFVRPQPGGMTGIGIREVTDGTSNTVITVEVTDKRAINWTRPGDFAPRKEDPQQGLRVDQRRGMSLAFSDGSVQSIPKTTPKETLMSLFTKAGGEIVERPRN